MGWLNKLAGIVSNNGVEVDATNQLNVVTAKSTTPAKVGGTLIYSENDPGTITGTPYLKAPRTSTDFRLNIGMDTPIANYTFNATSQDTGQWRYVTATMTTTFTQSGLVLNANSTLTTATGTAVSSYDQLTLLGNGGLHIEISGGVTSIPLTNQVFEAGIFPFAAGTGAPTDGVYFRLTSAGLVGVLNYNGVETVSGILIAAGDIPINTNAKYTLNINEREVEFWVNDIYLGEIGVSGGGQPFASSCLPITFQCRNAGVVVGTPMQVKITDYHADQLDVNMGKSWGHILNGFGNDAAQGQSGNTMGSTALYSNNLAAGAGAAMTNTTAALGAGLGGQFSALPTLAVGTDGIVCSFLNPAGSTIIIPKTLYITGIRIQGAVTTALAGGPVLYAYSLAWGGTAVTMAQAEGVAAKAYRRIPLCYENYPVTAPVGSVGSAAAIFMDFSGSPKVVNPGEYMAICAKNLGVVTTLGVITIQVMVTGYWE